MCNPDLRKATADAIKEARLRPSLYLSAKNLLERAGDDGLVWLEKDELVAECGGVNYITACRYLGELAEHGLIKYDIKYEVHVKFPLFCINKRQGHPAVHARCEERFARGDEQLARYDEQSSDPANLPAARRDEQFSRGDEQSARRDEQPSNLSDLPATRRHKQLARRNERFAPAHEQLARCDEQPSYPIDLPAARRDEQFAPAHEQSARCDEQSARCDEPLPHTCADARCLFVCSDLDPISPSESDQDKQTNKQTRTRTYPAAQTAQSERPSITRPPCPEPLPAMYARRAKPNAAEQMRSIALLTDPEVAITGYRANLLAKDYPFEYLLTQVFCYLRDLAIGRVINTGALIRRIESHFDGALIDADRNTALWQRHVPADLKLTIAGAPINDEEARRQKYIPAEYADIIIG